MARKTHAYTPISRSGPEPTQPSPAELVSDGVVGLKEAARLCGHGVRWVRDQIAANRIASFVMGRRRVIARKVLIDFLAAEMVKAAG